VAQSLDVADSGCESGLMVMRIDAAQQKMPM
jgi:hypothetical protein